MASYSPCACCVCSTRSYFVSPSTTAAETWASYCRATNRYDDWYQCAVAVAFVLDPLPVKGRGWPSHKKRECDRKMTAQEETLLLSSTWKQQLLRQWKRSNMSAVNVGWQVIPGKHANSAQQWIVTVYSTFLIIFSTCLLMFILYILGILLCRKIPRGLPGVGGAGNSNLGGQEISHHFI